MNSIFLNQYLVSVCSIKNRIHNTTKLKPQEIIKQWDEEFKLSVYNKVDASEISKIDKFIAGQIVRIFNFLIISRD